MTLQYCVSPAGLMNMTLQYCVSPAGLRMTGPDSSVEGRVNMVDIRELCQSEAIEVTTHLMLTNNTVHDAGEDKCKESLALSSFHIKSPSL